MARTGHRPPRDPYRSRNPLPQVRDPGARRVGVPLLVLHRLHDVRLRGGARGQEPGKDADEETGEQGGYSRDRRVVKSDLKAAGGAAADEEVAEQGADGDADEAPDQAYHHPFVYDDAPDLHPRRSDRPQDTDLARPLEDAHGQRVDDPEGRDGDGDAHDRVKEHVLAVEVALDLLLPLRIGVERELRVVPQNP